jgi:CheY-like chemotaxis protein
MVLGFAEQSGGTVTIDSTPGYGTTVGMWLPWSEEVARPEGEPPAVTVAGAAEAAVLLVDDDPDVLETTAASLADLGYRVTPVSSAAAALDLLRAGTEVDLLVADYVMPGMHGANLARAARRLLPSLPVLIVTGYSDRTAESADDLDVVWMNKPFRQAELAANLQAMLKRSAGAPTPAGLPKAVE